MTATTTTPATEASATPTCVGPVSITPYSVSVDVAAGFVGLPPAAIRSAISNGQLAVRYVSGRAIVFVDDLRRWIDEAPRALPPSRNAALRRARQRLAESKAAASGGR